jgi:heat-inducible transcriptional repressor
LEAKPLAPRSESLLKTLIDTYLLAGEPVGSRLLSERYGEEALSSATIRHVLSDLEEEEYLVQPHTSSGRIPSEKAYRYYVNRWVRPEAPDLEAGARLKTTLEEASMDPEIWVRHATRVLSEVMQGVCVALPRRLAKCRLAKLEFLCVEGHRLVALWIGQSGEVEHQVMDNPWDFTPEMLVEIGNFATAHFRGRTLPEMRQRLMASLQDRAQEAREIREKLASLTTRMDVAEIESQVVVAGLGTLGQFPEFEDFEAFRALIGAFEAQERLARLLNAFAEASASQVQLLLGSENPFLGSMPLATAVRTVPLGVGEVATFAVVGPLRMNYGRVLGGLQWWSEELARRNPWGV